jgi:prepilin peptidase CpaA
MALWFVWLIFGVLVAVLTAAAVFDARTGRIPNRLTYSAILFGLLAWTAWGFATAGVWGGLLAAGASMAACLAGAVPAAVAFAMGGLGGGDVKLIATIGAVTADWRLVLAAAVYALAIAVAMALYIVVTRGLVRQTGRRLAGAALLAVGRRSAGAALRGAGGPEIPFGVALAIGGIVAAIEHHLGIALPWTPYVS